jgi:hypothetical protein
MTTFSVPSAPSLPTALALGFFELVLEEPEPKPRPMVSIAKLCFSPREKAIG